MKASITGSHGFLGSALNKRLLEMGWQTYSYIRPDVDYVFLFGSPSSNILFDKNPDKCMSDTINGFLDAIRFCRDHHIKLVYPSSATIHNKNTNYARCKSILEEIHLSYDTPALGLRIYAGYGPGEGHKGDYASIVYQFCKQMKQGKSPIIFGNGNQSRDFIYIDDIIDRIMMFIESGVYGIQEVGTGVDTSFNRIVDIINSELRTHIKPIYVDKPIKYVEETLCPEHRGFKINIQEGIRRILNDPTL